jgi:hypothetical protein
MSEEKKIIIDEDWKSRVAAEKESAQRGGEGKASAGVEGPSTASPGSAAPPLPPASFEMLVTTLASEAMISLGQLPHPLTGKIEHDARQARYAIDMLEVLEEKTTGNLTPEEDRGLKELLHQLRMAFVSLESLTGQRSAAAEFGGEGPSRPRPIVDS